MSDTQPADPAKPPVQEEKGVWDASFARIASYALAVAVVLVSLFAALTFNRVAGYPTASRSTEEWVDGSFADRAAFTLALLGLWVGALLLLIAAFLAAVEVRSRLVALREITATGEPGDFTSQTTGPVKEVVLAVTEALTKARGTAVVAIAGAAVVVVALF